MRYVQAAAAARVQCGRGRVFLDDQSLGVWFHTETVLHRFVEFLQSAEE